MNFGNFRRNWAEYSLLFIVQECLCNLMLESPMVELN